MAYIAPTPRADGYVVPASEWNQSTIDNVLPWSVGGWTPTIGGSGGTSGQTYATQLGTYVKIGELVFVGFDVTLTAKGVITGNVQIQGLPFASGVIAHGVSLDGINVLATSVVSVAGNLAAAETAVTVVIRTAAATSPTAAVTADIANNTRLSGSFCYRAAS